MVVRDASSIAIDDESAEAAHIKSVEKTLHRP
jgi:hypothetical protein